jgi:hypothetical protein
MSSRSETGVERFKPTAGYWLGVVGIVGLVLAAAMTIYVSRSTAAVATVLAMLWCALVVWVALVRPAVHAHGDHLLLRNMLRDTEVPWHLVDDVAVRQTTRVYVDDRVHHGIALGRSTRSMMKQSLPSGGGSGAARLLGLHAIQDQANKPTLMGIDVSAMHYADFVEIRLMELAKERAEASRKRPIVDRRWVRLEATSLVVLGVVTAIVIALA